MTLKAMFDKDRSDSRFKKINAMGCSVVIWQGNGRSNQQENRQAGNYSQVHGRVPSSRGSRTPRRYRCPINAATLFLSLLNLVETFVTSARTTTMVQGRRYLVDPAEIVLQCDSASVRVSVRRTECDCLLRLVANIEEVHESLFEWLLDGRTSFAGSG